MTLWTWKTETLLTCPSTNSELKARLKDGRAQIGHVLLTQQQSGGRGRLQRSWISPEGNLAFSLIAPLRFPDKAYQLNWLAALSVAQALEAATQHAFAIKWPNDVYLQGRKVCGILSEVLPEHNAVLVGIGLNLNSTRNDFPAELQDKLTTVADATGHKLEAEAVQSAILQNLLALFAQYHDTGLAKLLPEIRARLLYQGQSISVCEADGAVSWQGILAGLTDEGFLLVQTSQGLVPIVAGDISLRPAP